MKKAQNFIEKVGDAMLGGRHLNGCNHKTFYVAKSGNWGKKKRRSSLSYSPGRIRRGLASHKISSKPTFTGRSLETNPQGDFV